MDIFSIYFIVYFAFEYSLVSLEVSLTVYVFYQKWRIFLFAAVFFLAETSPYVFCSINSWFFYSSLLNWLWHSVLLLRMEFLHLSGVIVRGFKLVSLLPFTRDCVLCSWLHQLKIQVMSCFCFYLFNFPFIRLCDLMIASTSEKIDTSMIRKECGVKNSFLYTSDDFCVPVVIIHHG